MDGTDTPDPRRDKANRKFPVRMIVSILLGAVVIAAAAVSVWFAVGPRGDAVILAVYVDPTTEAQSKLDIIGVPTTLLIDREGREIARYLGPAEWDRPEIIATIQRYLPPPKS